MSRKNTKPTRLIFTYRGKCYKFMSFFVDEHDNSFYFHIYRKKGETPMFCDDHPSQAEPLRIHFPSFKPTGFEENKISFHESGYIHSTDKRGKRYRDGVVGIPFENVQSFLFILAIAPKNPLEMIAATSIDRQNDLQIHLKDDANPFVVQFAVVRKGTESFPKMPSEQNLLSGFIKCDYRDRTFGLVLALTKVLNASQSIELNWPPFNLILKRVA